MLIKQSMFIVVIGLAGGTGGAIVLSKYIASILYLAASPDPVLFTIVVLFMALVSFIAILIPSLKLLRFNIVKALKSPDR
jgi:ABC-type antimicrobial peptide transport system permease subunit